jgi:LEA14-like dessication related protein
MKIFSSYIIKISLLLLIFSLSSCKEIEQLELEGVENFAVKNLSIKGMTLELDMKVYNPNNIKFKVKKYDLDIYVNNMRIGKAKIKQKMVLPKRSSSSHHLTVETDFKDLLLGALPLISSLQKKNQAKVRVTGNIKVSVLGISKKVDVEFQKEVTLRK